mgnify:CR=1 FL=1
MKDTLRIFIICSYALSSSLFAEKMQEVSNKKNLPIKVKFFSPEKLKENLDNCDVVMLSPQVRFNKAVFIELLAPYKVPVVVIPMETYGLADAEKAIELAIKSYEEMQMEGGKDSQE